MNPSMQYAFTLLTTNWRADSGRGLEVKNLCAVAGSFSASRYWIKLGLGSESRTEASLNQRLHIRTSRWRLLHKSTDHPAITCSGRNLREWQEQGRCLQTSSQPW